MYLPSGEKAGGGPVNGVISPKSIAIMYLSSLFGGYLIMLVGLGN
jgi:hypothetical protein